MYNDTKIIETISKIKKSLNKIAASMKVDERMETKDIVQRVIEDTNIDRTTAVGLVSVCIKNSDHWHQRRGRNGGTFRVC